MFSRSNRLRRSVSSAITHRWVRSRPGSVLILVIALLVLLALIGTAYLSSTQTERYTSVQNTVNTQADLLIDGLAVNVESRITNGLYGNTLANQQQFRPGYQEMDQTATGIVTGATYHQWDSAVDEDFLSDRIPILYTPNTTITAQPAWNSTTWSIFPDTTGFYSTDSPFDSSIPLPKVSEKVKIISIPTYATKNGQVLPAMAYYVPSPNGTTTITTLNGQQTVSMPGAFLAPYATSGGTGLNAMPFNPANIKAAGIVTASASGDGIADAGMFKVPVGPINGITYYGTVRIIDNNSAVNVSTAWSTSGDPTVGNEAESLFKQSSNRLPSYGFFRTNVGLRELLSNTAEMDNLNSYRLNNGGGGVSTNPIDDTATPRTDFGWYSAGDALDTQLARRPLNPGYDSNTTKFVYLDKNQSAPLAYRFGLVNKTIAPSLIEQMLPNETYNSTAFPTSPYTASQIANSTTPSQQGYWFGDLFNFDNNYTTLTAPYMPIRTLLTASNPVSNGIPNRLGNSGATWSSSSTYNFGDWVVSPTDGKSYVCLLPVTAASMTDPSTANAAGTPEYWGLVPWKYQPVKASVHTATFEQLWINFCQVMTDSIAAAGKDATQNATTPQWQPPLMPTSTPGNLTYAEEQIQQFRSVIRDNRSVPIGNNSSDGYTNTGQPGVSTTPPGGGAPTSTASTSYATRVQMTPMQMMQLRAAIAAINTVSIRNTNTNYTALGTRHMTRSRRIVLPDTTGAPAFDVEVFGNDIQPFIGQMYAQVNDPIDTTQNFIAIQLINPFTDADIYVNPDWVFATIDRTKAAAAASLTLKSIATGNSIKIPRATVVGGVVVPGMATIYDGAQPTNFKLPTTSKSYPVSQLAQAIGQELVILRPRKLSLNTTGGDQSTLSSPIDSYNEKLNIFDLVPVDQLDMTGTNNATAGLKNLYYRRAADPTKTGTPGTHVSTYAWNFVWPGFYTPYNLNNTGGPNKAPDYTPVVVTTTSPTNAYTYSQAIVANATDPNATNPNFDALCYGGADVTAASPLAPTYYTTTLQLANTSFPGANPVGLTPTNKYPFGGFTRNADLLQIPYIGAYRISDYNKPINTDATHEFYEMNSVTMDASLANDSTLQFSKLNPYSATAPKTISSPGDVPIGTAGTVAGDSVTDPFLEQIGHFCPIGDTRAATYTSASPSVPATQLDFGTSSDNWHYHWTKKLFDYFTVQAPHDDYFPNVDPDLAYADYGAAAPKYPLANKPVPVANTTGTANSGEDLVGVEGLININTAPWPVLAQLPFFTNGVVPEHIVYTGIANTTTTTTTGSVPDNIQIAKAIVDYRNLNGPFKSIYDLYNVPAFRLENDALLANDPDFQYGDFSPGNIIGTSTVVGNGISNTPPATSTYTTPTTNTDGARFDFEERFMLLNQISNLITTRSDTFTCYVDLQGWRNVGTGNPSLAVERRKAFIFDRNAYSPAYKNPVYFPVPNN